MDTISNDELLYYGSILVNFAYHSGSVHQINIDSVDELNQHTKTTEKAIPISDEYENLVLPYMPTTSIEISKLDNSKNKLPDELCRPLIKTALPSLLKGVISGTRSALIKCNSSKWYRLKGCGNDTDGFLIKPVSDSNKQLTIRGCAFLQTTYRELLMTQYISRLFAFHKIQCANTSVGWFEYQLGGENTDKDTSDIPTIQDANLNRWSPIARCCILMETLGNKRLSDHVLYGIEQLFSLIKCDDKSHVIDQSNLKLLFPSERLTNSNHNNEEFVLSPTWLASLTKTLQPINYQNSNWLLRSSYFFDVVPTDIEENQWKMLWKSNIDLINNYLQNTKESLSDLLCLLYKRFGFECGSILGLMHFHRISWGTYRDALGMHCNAHPNNLIIKLSSSASSFLLAPLDFDMSFSEENYVPNEFNDQSFDDIIKLELSGFQLTLSGDTQASSGVTAWIEMIDDQWTNGRWLLRDIMLNEFNTTYDETLRSGSIEIFETISHEQNSALQAIIRLALIKTMKEIG